MIPFYTCLPILQLLASSVAFQVQMPSKVLTVVHGQTVVLGCIFAADGNSSTEQIIVTWQRGTEVVHSYYYDKDQLDKQDLHFANRTSLYPAQFKNGNASLKLEGVHPEDAGTYKCYVSNLQGSDFATVVLKTAAYYTEPHLLIKAQKTSVTFVMESEGYPIADFSWHRGEDFLTDIGTGNFSSVNDRGLLTVKSVLEVKDLSLLHNYTFVLRNEILNQTLTRTVHFSTELLAESSVNGVAVTACILMLLLLIILLFTKKYQTCKSVNRNERHRSAFNRENLV
ncbi:CD276 antigen-like [Protopterus annectens]|uniref:CD276 antigen-like n=1 Tax=Protopterus annectens TaxID=7888 RepID=UPI001CFA4593|nr:CD276 antigen-like [Protopterus annectens]